MNATVVAALVGFVSALLGTVVAGYINQQRFHAELRAQRRRDYLTRQMAACEAIWKQLLPLTEYHSTTAVIHDKGGVCLAFPLRAARFCEDITTEFFAPTGLYLSKDARQHLFRLRSFLNRSLVLRHPGVESIEVSRRFVRTFLALKTSLIRALRDEVGVIDLQVGRESFAEPEAVVPVRARAPGKPTHGM